MRRGYCCKVKSLIMGTNSKGHIWRGVFSFILISALHICYLSFIFYYTQSGSVSSRNSSSLIESSTLTETSLFLL